MPDAPQQTDVNRDRPATAPWRSKPAGIACLLGAALLLSGALYWCFLVYDTGSLKRYDILIVALLAVAGFPTFTFGRKLLAPSAEEVLARDGRPPVVYLRPFDEDSRPICFVPLGRRSGGRPISESSGPSSREQKLARAFKGIGPFIGVGAPGDSISPLGAARLYLADKDWQREVEALVRGAAAIVLVPETSEGTRWEVTKVVRWVDPLRVLIIIPNPASRPLGYARIQALTAETLPIPLPANCSNADAFMFDRTGQPQPIVFGRNVTAALQPFLTQVRKLFAEPVGHA